MLVFLDDLTMRFYFLLLLVMVLFFIFIYLFFWLGFLQRLKFESCWEEWGMRRMPFMLYGKGVSMECIKASVIFNRFFEL